MKDNKKFWDRFAGLYTKIQEKSNQKVYDLVALKMEKYVNDKSVLELASGTGQFTAPLYKKAESYIATDFSENMVKNLKKRLKDAKVLTADATLLPFESCSFDVVIMANALHIMPYPQKAIKEILRVLKDDGIFLCPNFVWQGKENKFRMFITNLAGFKTFNKWNEQDIKNYVEERGFSLLESEVFPADPIPECFLAFKKM